MLSTVSQEFYPEEPPSVLSNSVFATVSYGSHSHFPVRISSMPLWLKKPSDTTAYAIIPLMRYSISNKIFCVRQDDIPQYIPYVLKLNLWASNFPFVDEFKI